MSEPSQAERAFATRHKIDPAKVSRAREVLNAIVSRPWPRTEQIALVARVAKKAAADVGAVLAGLALNRAPVVDFTDLLPLKGLGEKRVAGLARALSTVDIATLSPEAAALQQAQTRVTALTAENETLRAEIDRLHLVMRSTTEPTPTTTMRLQEVAGSLTEQIAKADASVRATNSRLHLSGVELRVQGTASSVGSDLALDISDPHGGSAVGLKFVPAGMPIATPGPTALIDVRGYGLALARRKIAAAGFSVALAKESAGAAPRGVVTDQSPAPGTLVPPGAVVRLVIA